MSARDDRGAPRRGNIRGLNGLAGQLADHRGEWVAVRADHVVAAAGTLEELLANADVRPDDTRMAVPQAAATLRLRS